MIQENEEEIHRWTKIIHRESGEEIKQQRRLIVRFEQGEASIIKQISDPEDYDWRAVQAWRVTPTICEKTLDDFPGVSA